MLVHTAQCPGSLCVRSVRILCQYSDASTSLSMGASMDARSIRSIAPALPYDCPQHCPKYCPMTVLSTFLSTALSLSSVLPSTVLGPPVLSLGQDHHQQYQCHLLHCLSWIASQISCPRRPRERDYHTDSRWSHHAIAIPSPHTRSQGPPLLYLTPGWQNINLPPSQNWK